MDISSLVPKPLSLIQPQVHLDKITTETQRKSEQVSLCWIAFLRRSLQSSEGAQGAHVKIPAGAIGT